MVALGKRWRSCLSRKNRHNVRIPEGTPRTIELSYLDRWMIFDVVSFGASRLLGVGFVLVLRLVWTVSRAPAQAAGSTGAVGRGVRYSVVRTVCLSVCLTLRSAVTPSLCSTSESACRRNLDLSLVSQLDWRLQTTSVPMDSRLTVVRTVCLSNTSVSSHPQSLQHE
jgi:hypothetical protein